MLLAPFNEFQWKVSNWDGLTGTTVTPGTSSAEGTWTQLLSATAEEIWAFVLSVSSGNAAGKDKCMLLDIGIDPAGGTNYTAIVNSLACGGTDGFPGGYNAVFPLKIPAGSTIAVRVQGFNGTPGTVAVRFTGYGCPSRPELVAAGQCSETVGSVASSKGVSFTPGNAAEGAWASLGVTVADLWNWRVCAQVGNTIQTALSVNVDLAFGDGTNMVMLIENYIIRTNASEISQYLSHDNIAGINKFVPAGSTLYVRGYCDAAPNTGWNAVAVGIGG